ncbi:MAG TPA: MFS transporter [Acidimicrobiales bacterium]|nr:MFS transporter [Acidimicrobiales bacterium]
MSTVTAADGAVLPREGPARPLARFDPRRITAPHPLAPLVVLIGLASMVQLDGSAFGILVPDIKNTYHLSLTGISFITAVSLPLGLLVDVPVGYYADRVPRMRLTCAGLAVFVVFSVLTGAAGAAASLLLLYVARGGVAVGAAFTSTQNSLLADFYPIEIRPRVYYAQRAAVALALALGPALVAVFELYYSWEVPFLVLAAPTLIFIVLGLRIREPTRGLHERRYLGADEATAHLEDEPPTFSETFRVLFANRSSRRIYYSLPFLTAAAIGITQFTSLFYQQILHQDASRRGLIVSLTEPGEFIGLAVGLLVVQRLMSKDPGRTLRLIALTGIGSAACLCVFALAPSLAWAFGAHFMYTVISSALTPGIFAVISLAVPPRMRTLGFATSSLWFILGVPIIPIVGAVGDRFGIRAGLLIFVPVYVLGAVLLSTAGGFLNGDIEKVRVSTLARAEVRKARMEGRARLLMIRALDSGYDAVQVLFGVNLDVADGEMLAVLGTNGAGKSTLLRTISGLLVPTAGAVLFDGRDITSADPNRIAEGGIMQVPGGRGIFPGLTVAESLRVAGWMYESEPEYLAAATEEVLGYFPILRRRWDTTAGNLSGGEQQMLSLAQAFVARPRLLLIDELSLGLAPTVVESLLGIVRAIHAQGTTVVLVEQSVALALRLCDRAVFMEKGQIVFSGPTAELLERDDLVRAVLLEGAGGRGAGAGEGNGSGPARAGRSPLGTSTGSRFPTAAVASPPAGNASSADGPQVVLGARGLRKSFGGVTAVDDFDFDLYQGETLGLIGPNGAGKTTAFELVSGHLRADRGQVDLFGRDVSDWPAHRRAQAGLGRSFQAARLWPGLTVRETVAVAVSNRIRTPGALLSLSCLPVVGRAERKVAVAVDETLELLGLTGTRDLLIGDLSTGTRRLVELAVMVAMAPRVILLDEPSAGIAQAESEALVPILLDTRDHLGATMMVIEHDMGVMRGVADRIVAMDAGRVVAVGTPDEVMHDPRVVESYLGAVPAG